MRPGSMFYPWSMVMVRTVREVLSPSVFVCLTFEITSTKSEIIIISTCDWRSGVAVAVDVDWDSKDS